MLIIINYYIENYSTKQKGKNLQLFKTDSTMMNLPQHVALTCIA